MARSIGTHLGGAWRLVRIVGTGGTATVYQVEGRLVPCAAAKLLHESLAADRRWRRRFENEARILQSIEHPGLPKVYEFGIDGKAQFLIMELLAGESLASAAKNRKIRLSTDRILALVAEALDVLAAVHARGIVHRDLKPSNLFLTAEGRLKVLDFGIAGGATSSRGDSHTQGMLGTPSFMAPEQARGRWEEVDHRSDIWSMGAVAFTLLTGEHVHPAETANEQLGLAMSRSARSIAVALPSLDPAVASVIDRALEYDPARRFDSAREFRQALLAPSAYARSARREARARLTDDTERYTSFDRLQRRRTEPRAGAWVAGLMVCAGFAAASDAFPHGASEAKEATAPMLAAVTRLPTTALERVEPEPTVRPAHTTARHARATRKSSPPFQHETSPAAVVSADLDDPRPLQVATNTARSVDPLDIRR